VNHTYKFISKTCIKTKNKDLVWEDFSRFYELMISMGELEASVFETYPNLTNFVWSWCNYKKNKGIPLEEKHYIGSSNWKFGLRRASSK